MAFIDEWIKTYGKEKIKGDITTPSPNACTSALKLIIQAIKAAPLRWMYKENEFTLTQYHKPEPPEIYIIDEGYKNYARFFWEIYLGSGYDIFSMGCGLQWSQSLQATFRKVFKGSNIEFVSGCQLKAVALVVFCMPECLNNTHQIFKYKFKYNDNKLYTLYL